MIIIQLTITTKMISKLAKITDMVPSSGSLKFAMETNFIKINIDFNRSTLNIETRIKTSNSETTFIIKKQTSSSIIRFRMTQTSNTVVAVPVSNSVVPQPTSCSIKRKRKSSNSVVAVPTSCSIKRNERKINKQIIRDLFTAIKLLFFIDRTKIYHNQFAKDNIQQNIEKIIELMDLCKTRGIDPKDSNGMTPLHSACTMRAADIRYPILIIDILIHKYNCDINNSCKKKPSYKHLQIDKIKSRRNGNNILHIAVHSRDKELFKYLLLNGAKFNSINSNGISILDALIERQRFQEQSEKIMARERGYGQLSLKESKQIFADMLTLYHIYIDFHNGRIAFCNWNIFCIHIKRYILSYILI